MFSLQIFVIALFGIHQVTCLRKVYCAADDEACLTKAARDHVFPKLMPGMPGVDPSEPLRLIRLVVDLPNLRLSLLNATMTGVKDCKMKFKKNAEDTQFEYQPCCPLLTVESEYDAEGKIDGVAVKGRGTFKLTYENFNFYITGNQQKVEFGDCKQHFRLLNYTKHLDLKGKNTYDYKNLMFGDKGKCKCPPAQRSRYYDRFEEITRTPIIEAFVDKFMENVRNFHIAVPVEELYYKYV